MGMIHYLISVFLIIVPILSYGSEESGVLLADMVFFDKNTSTYRAEGNVEMETSGRVLFADIVIYDTINDRVFAVGNITLFESSGDVFYGEEAELVDEFKHGVVSEFRASLVDESIVIADKAKRTDEMIFELEKARYSPCRFDPNMQETPEWQLRARNLTLDKEKETLYYRHVFFDYRGVPVFYSPFLSHPSPNAHRKSGFLRPEYGIISDVGTFIKLPYYFNILPNRDFTFTTMLTTEQGPLVIGEYRDLSKYGEYSLGGSFTYPEDYRTENGVKLLGYKQRSHVEGKGEFDFKNKYYADFEFKRASDDSYLKTYDFTPANYLKSEISIDRISGRDISYFEIYSFQGLLPTDRPANSPTILPLLNHYQETSRFRNGSYFFTNLNTMILSRGAGVQSRRLTAKLGYMMPYRSRFGHDINLSFYARGDIYNVENVPNPLFPNNEEKKFTGSMARTIPEARLDWSFPLIRNSRDSSLILEPMANIFVSSPGGNDYRIPNEDSIDIELSDDNLFNASRFAGLDRIETGTRMNYGLSTSYYEKSNLVLNLLLGQVYRFKEDKVFQRGSGMDSNSSDLVGRIHFIPSTIFDIFYRARLDSENYAINRSELTSRLMYDPFTLVVNFASINDPQPGSLTATRKREEVLASLDYKLGKFFKANFNGRRNLAKDGKMITTGGALIYESDCLTFKVKYEKDHTKDKNLSRQEKYYFTLDLKNLLSLNL